MGAPGKNLPRPVMNTSCVMGVGDRNGMLSCAVIQSNSRTDGDHLARPLHNGRRMKALGLALAILLWSGAASATTRICVGVQQKSWYKPAPAPVAPRAPAPTAPAATSDDDHPELVTPAGAGTPHSAPTPQQEL